MLQALGPQRILGQAEIEEAWEGRTGEGARTQADFEDDGHKLQ